MDGSFLQASSFHPPAATRATSRYAPWALLDCKAYFAVHENATTAEAVTSTGRTIKVTFCLADPPAISHFCVHGPDFQRDDFTTEPLVLFSAKDLVLFRFSFTIGPRSTRWDYCLAEYFVYKAGRGKPPSLTPIPHTPSRAINSFHICVLPFDQDDDEGFVLADLFMTMHRTDYQLHVFSSKTARWTITALQLQASPGVREEDLPSPFLDKVIALGEGVVGWVDLYRGIVSCNVFDKNPVLGFIPIPMLGDCTEQRRTHDPRPVRDVTCCNGFIKFVKLDLRCKLHESNTSVGNGWKLQTWYRHTSSWDYWHKEHDVDVDDISTDNLDSETGLPLWLWCQQTPTLWDAEAGRWALGNMFTGYPILGIDGHDVVYLMSKATFVDKNAWMLGVDLAKKTVDVLLQVSSERLRYFNPKFLTCEFSEYLNATPRSSIDIVNRAPNEAQDYHLSFDNIAESSLAPQHGNSSCYNGSFYGHSHTVHSGYLNYQHPPTWWANSPQPLHTNLTSQGSGYVYPANAQSMDPVADTDGELWFSLLMGPTEPPPPCDSTRLYRLF